MSCWKILHLQTIQHTNIRKFNVRLACLLLLLLSVSVCAYIQKGGSRGSRTPQTILNFPQKDCLRTRKVSRLHCLQSYWRSFSLFMSSPWNKLSIKTLKHYILNKNATLTPNSCDFYDLRNFVAKFCCQNVRTFSADFFGLKNWIPQTLSFFGCMHPWPFWRSRPR